MPSKPIPTKRHNPCPVCGDTKGKCRELPDNPDLFLCMEVLDAAAVPPGFKFRGLSKDGIWATITRDRGDGDVDSYQRWLQEWRILKQQRLQQEKNRLARLLDEGERDRNIRKILHQLNLDQKHRDDLYRRGLSDELVASGMFRSVEQWQQLDREVSHHLAGVAISGRSLTHAQSGYLCPIWNSQQQIIGWQLRVDDPKEDEGKYRWPTSATKKRPHGSTAHLCSGELPLTYCVPKAGVSTDSILTEYIALAEGILKPWVLAQKRQQIVIGAAGGNHAGSPQTLRRYLDDASTKLNGTKKVLLYADAGAAHNRHVVTQYRRTYKLLKSWGYTMRVAWWGQLTKDCADPDEYSGSVEAIAWAQFEALARNPDSFWDDIKKYLGRIARVLQQAKSFDQPQQKRRHGQPAPRQSLQQPQSQLAIATDKLVKFIDCQEYCQQAGLPYVVARYGQREDRLAVWQRAVAKGWQHILDRSAPGLGKSHAVGEALPEDFGLKHLWYLANDHRNPTTLTVEQNYFDLPVRHNGLVVDESRSTPANKPYLVHPTSIEATDVKMVQGNCHRYHLFQWLRQKNIAGIEGGDSPICQSCHLLNACRSGSGKGYGFRHLRMEALQKSRLRAHPDSIPAPADYIYTDCGMFWDEASVVLRSLDAINVTQADFDRAIGELALKLPAIMPVLQPMLTALRSLWWAQYGEQPLWSAMVNVELLPKPRYGWDDTAIRKMLPPVPENIQQIADEVEVALAPNLESLAQQPDGIALSSVEQEWKGAARQFNMIARQERYRDLTAELEQMPLNWLVPLLRIWGGGEVGYLRFDRGLLSIGTRNWRYVDVATSAKFNIYLDGTVEPQVLAAKLGIGVDEILVIEQEIPTYENIEIVHVTDMGVLGRDRRDTMNVRLAALKDALKKIHPDMRFIERKQYAEAGDGYHFRDSRGVNHFLNATVLASIGIPYPNISVLAAEYQVLTGRPAILDEINDGSDGAGKASTSEGKLLGGKEERTVGEGRLILGDNGAVEMTFQDYINACVRAEILQEIGRLRSHLRLDEHLKYYFVADYDLGFVRQLLPGVRVVERSAVEIATAAGTTKQRTIWSLTKLFSQIVRQGEKPTQQAIAGLAAGTEDKMSQGRISQVCREFGGWSVFNKLLQTLLSSFASKYHTEHLLDADALWAKDVYLPLLASAGDISPTEVAKEVISTVEVFGWRVFRQILEGTSIEAKAQLLEQMLLLAPDCVQGMLLDVIALLPAENSS